MKMLVNILKLAALTAAAIFLQSLANEYALMERGYKAMGGEVFVFPVVIILGAYLLGLFRNSTKSEEDEEESEEDHEDDGDGKEEPDVAWFKNRNH